MDKLVSAGHDERERGGGEEARKRKGSPFYIYIYIYIQTPDQPPTRPDVIHILKCYNLKITLALVSCE